MSWSGLCTGVLDNPASLQMHLLRAAPAGQLLPRDQCPCGVTQGLPLPLSPHPWCRLVQAGREASPLPAELPHLPRRPNQSSSRRLRFVRHDLISASLPRRPRPGRLRGAAFVCSARRQTAAGKRPSITAPFSVSPPEKGRKRGWWLRWETGAARAAPHPLGRDMACSTPEVALAICQHF